MKKNGRMSCIIRNALAIAAAAAIAGCAAAGTLAPSAGNPQYARPGSSAKAQSLLYVSSVLTDEVYVYSFTTQQLVQTLQGFKNPYGLCADTKGDVWVVDDGAQQIVEFAHGATSAKATLQDPGEYPEGCAVDPVTGNLAVTNFYAASGNGSVAIYAHATGTPEIYSDATIVEYRFCSYDAHGNLFVDGANSASAFAFAELPKGSTSFKDITLGHSVEWPGGVQAAGKHVVIGDTDAGAIYLVKGPSGNVKRTVQLGNSNYVNEFWIAGHTVVAANQDGGNVTYYSYPAGGTPTATIDVQEPFGVTVSAAK